ncbi:hypothetical protein KY313_01295 [Candidatus Woesearchaeota archaeon]|nr:hypothetical protein [Candidatus Woesearchaeota archaeon]
MSFLGFGKKLSTEEISEEIKNLTWGIEKEAKKVERFERDPTNHENCEDTLKTLKTIRDISEEAIKKAKGRLKQSFV